MDGAHTHHHGTGGGLGAALAVAAGLVLVSQAARLIAAVLHALLIGLAAAAGLALTGLITCAAIACRRRARAVPVYQRTAPPAAGPPVAQLHAARPAAIGRAETHRHLHFHGLTPEQVVAILAATAADREGGADGQP